MSRRLSSLAVLAVVGSLALGGCSSGKNGTDTKKTDTSGASSTSSAPLNAALPAAVKKAGTITVGASIDYPPFEYYAADGKTLQGFETELAAALEKQLGVKFAWKNANFDTLFTALRTGRYDIVYGAVNDTGEREKTFDFVDYLQSSQGFVAAKGNPKGIKTIDDICGQVIAAVRGGIQAQFLESQSTTCTKQGKSKINVLTFDGNSGEQLAVKQGRAAAMLENYPTAATFAKESHGELELIPNLQVSKRFFGMVVNKNNTQLRDVLAKAWQAIIDDGSYGKVLAKWNLSDIAVKNSVVNAVKSGQSAP